MILPNYRAKRILSAMHQGRDERGVPLLAQTDRQWVVEVEARVSPAIKSGFCEPRERTRNTPLDVLSRQDQKWLQLEENRLGFCPG